MADLKLYAWITRGRQRMAMLKAFSMPMTSSQIHKKSKHYNKKISLNNTSDILRDFVRQGIAVCLNNEDRVGRIYQLSKDGEEIRKELMGE